MRKTLIVLLVVAAAAGSLARALSPVYVTPDVPTAIPAGPTLLPWEIYRYDAAGPTYTLVLTVPGSPTVDAIHKMDALGDWLVSVDAPSDLGGSLGSPAEPRDIVRFDGALWTPFFCPSLFPGLGIPPGVDVDAVYLEGGDAGRLVVSFDVPVELPPGSGAYFLPGDLVRWRRVGLGCGGWALAGPNPIFTGIPPGPNVIGADGSVGLQILSFDVPLVLAPAVDPTPPFFTRDELVSWDGATYAQFEALAGWPAASEINALSCLANPGRVPATITIGKATATPCNPCDLDISWAASCAEGGEDYGIYEGTIGTWYSHTRIDCDDAGSNLTELVTPAVGNRYYVVVPHSAKEEGSYGSSDNFPAGFDTERPVGATTCASPQVITACP